MTVITLGTSPRLVLCCHIGAIQVLRNADGGGGGVSHFLGKKRYEGIGYNVISVTRGWVGVQFPGGKRYVTLEWPHTQCQGYGVPVCVISLNIVKTN